MVKNRMLKILFIEKTAIPVYLIIKFKLQFQYPILIKFELIRTDNYPRKFRKISLQGNFPLLYAYDHSEVSWTFFRL